MITKQKIKNKLRKIIPYIHILLYISIILLITGDSPFGKLGGWTILIIIITYNTYYIWKSKEYLKQMKQYIFTIAKEKAKEKKGRRK